MTLPARRPGLTERGCVEHRRGTGKNSVDPLLLAGALDDPAMLSERHIRAVAVSANPEIQPALDRIGFVEDAAVVTPNLRWTKTGFIGWTVRRSRAQAVEFGLDLKLDLDLDLEKHKPIGAVSERLLQQHDRRVPGFASQALRKRRARQSGHRVTRPTRVEPFGGIQTVLL